MSSNPPAQPPQARRLSSSFGLAAAAIVLLVLFGVQVASALLPLRLLQPSWQLRFATNLITSAPLALTGLALHQLAVELAPQNLRLRRRQKFFSELAVVACLGFLLLIPLHNSAVLRQGRSAQDVQITRLQNAEARLQALRQVVVAATSNADLNRGLQELNGPVLGPADLAQPLPLLKAQVDAVLDQASLQISRERQVNPPLRRIALLPDLLRQSISSLALAFAFAALGRRPGAYRSPLQELQSAWERRSRLNQKRRSSKPLQDLLDRIRLLWMR